MYSSCLVSRVYPRLLLAIVACHPALNGLVSTLHSGKGTYTSFGMLDFDHIGAVVCQYLRTEGALIKSVLHYWPRPIQYDQ